VTNANANIRAPDACEYRVCVNPMNMDASRLSTWITFSRSDL